MAKAHNSLTAKEQYFGLLSLLCYIEDYLELALEVEWEGEIEPAAHKLRPFEKKVYRLVDKHLMGLTEEELRSLYKTARTLSITTFEVLVVIKEVKNTKPEPPQSRTDFLGANVVRIVGVDMVKGRRGEENPAEMLRELLSIVEETVSTLWLPDDVIDRRMVARLRPFSSHQLGELGEAAVFVTQVLKSYLIEIKEYIRFSGTPFLPPPRYPRWDSGRSHVARPERQPGPSSRL
jgi:hypothetical protein